MRRTAAVILFGLGACASPADRVAVVTVDDTRAVAEVDGRFLSIAVDIAQVVGTVFWNPDAQDEPEQSVEAYDFSRPTLRALAAELSPGFLRVGGTDADKIWYDLGDDPVSEPPDGYEGVLDAQTWDGVTGFANELGFTLLFTVNAGPGPRNEAGAWVPDNARHLLSTAVERGDPVEVWELGNEPNSFLLEHGMSMSAEQYAADADTLVALRDEVAPGALIAGPTTAFWPEAGEFVDFVEPFLAARPAIDLVT